VTLRDQKLISFKTKMANIDEILRRVHMWKQACQQLSTIVLQACSSVAILPDVPSPPDDSLAKLFGLHLTGQISTEGTLRDTYFSPKYVDAVAQYEDKKKRYILCNDFVNASIHPLFHPIDVSW
jgi:hypothetical protein